jgi:hypothetical protein
MTYEKWFTNLLSSRDFITTDKYLIAQENLGYRYVKRDYLYTFGKWRGKIQVPIYLKQIANYKRTLVVGHSDLHISKDDLRYIKFFGYKKVYGVNLLNTDGFSEAIPLGITNFCDDSNLHKLFGNIEHFRIAHHGSEIREIFDNSIYINFTSSNNLSERNGLTNLLKARKNVHFENTLFTESGRIEYLRSLREYAMVPCPEGNGFDTHRLWETLYMGGTPIVKQCDYLPTALNHLPVIVLSGWNKIQESKFLEEQWHLAQSKRMNFKYLTSTYWLNYISNQEIKSNNNV